MQVPGSLIIRVVLMCMFPKKSSNKMSNNPLNRTMCHKLS